MKKSLQFFAADISASIVVFLVALPLCLGIALGSQTPLFSGIIAGIVGGIVIGFLSKSSLSVSGPAAGLIAIVVLGIQKLGSFESFLLATFIAGILQIFLGYLRFGALKDFIPNAVIKGMLAAIGIILIIKQIPHFIGYGMRHEVDEGLLEISQQEKTLSNLLNITEHISPLAISIGIVGILILLLWETKFFKQYKAFKFTPAPLIVVIASAGINQFFIFNNSELALQQQHMVSLPPLNSFTDLHSILIFPDFRYILNHNVWIIAITIALVASVETLLCIEATDKIDPLKRRTDGNQELSAQGFGNSISALFGGLPITSVIVRSSANVNAGAQSKASAIFHGIWLMLSVIFIHNLLTKIPYAALAAILIITGYKLAKPSIFKELYKLGIDQLIPCIITILAILLTNLLLGICIGILVSFVFILYSNFKSSLMIVNNEKNHYLLRMRKDVSFLNKARLKNMLENLPLSSHVLIDTSRADFIDKDVIEVINDFSQHAHLKKITVEIKKKNFGHLHSIIKGNF
ncbi:MAG: SulP family inorganic anion transporter [Rickettsiales bacterium]|nr:SulP family inorganic anion transporter [Rickettsiales bacterium]